MTLGAAHALEMFKNEGLAPDAAKRVERFFTDGTEPPRPGD